MLRAVVALVLGLGLTAGAYLGAERLEEQVVERVYAEQVQRVGDVAIARASDVARPVREYGLVVARQEVNFGVFVPELQARADKAKALRAMAWMPVVKDRELFETQVGRYFQGFELREQTREGDVQTAGPAQAWVPFLLVFPEHENDVLRGLDIGNLKPLAETMQQAYVKDQPVVSPLFEFAVLDEPVMVMLSYVQEPEGFAAGLLVPSAFLDDIVRGRPEGMAARLTDNLTNTVLVEEPGFVEEGSHSFATPVGARTFKLELSPTSNYQPTQLRLPLAAGFAGAGVTVLMLALVLVGGGKREETEG